MDKLADKTGSTCKKNARLVARVTDDVQDIIQKAASYSGTTVTQFLIDCALNKAKSVIDDFETLKLTDEMATSIMKSLDRPAKPNAFLLKAKALYEKNVNVPNTKTNQATR